MYLLSASSSPGAVVVEGFVGVPRTTNGGGLVPPPLPQQQQQQQQHPYSRYYTIYPEQRQQQPARIGGALFFRSTWDIHEVPYAAPSPRSTATAAVGFSSYLDEVSNLSSLLLDLHIGNNIHPPPQQTNGEKARSLSTLTAFLRDSCWFTDAEIGRIADAIQTACAGDAAMAARATDYCLVLAETIDMGVVPLTAGAIHYCQQEQQLQFPQQRHRSSSSSGNPPPLESSSSYSNNNIGDSSVMDIVSDAGRLMQLETVAAAFSSSSMDRKSHNDNLRQLLLTETKDWRALALRTAASLVRLRTILQFQQQLQSQHPTVSLTLTQESVRAAREALIIYAPLASSLGMHRLKNELESAAFKILYRRQYEAVHSLHSRRVGGKSSNAESSTSSLRSTKNDNIGEAMHSVLDGVKTKMTAMFQLDSDLNREVEEFEITARVKEPYSMWKKMLRHGYDHVLQVPDALAVRIVLKAKKLSADEPADVTLARERALCYYVQKQCQEQWHPVAANPRFKDYIARPKANGYQSLHYTAQTDWRGESWTVEVQVRSAAMHQVAEFGLACHWDYKAAKKTTNNSKQPQQQEDFTVTITSDDVDNSSDSYLRNVQQYWSRQKGDMASSPDSDEEVAGEESVTSNPRESRERADRIRARTERLRPYLEALSTTQSDLARERVFVFMTTSEATSTLSSSERKKPACGAVVGGGSKVVALPSGACVLDALREGERTMKVGPFAAAFLNGEETPITKQLHNGDILNLCLATPTVTVS